MPRKQVSLNIKNPAVYEAAAKLSKLQGTTITAAVLNAVQTALEREERRRRAGNELQRMEAAARRINALPLLDSRSADQILGYGSEGNLDGD
jgi:antitoxin VapB